jgi:Cu/Ag efflux protein CusF
MSKLANILILTGFAVLPAAYADDAHHPRATTVAQAVEALAEGEIRKVDKDAKKITIKHGPITNLDMPAMTMVFQVKEPGLLEEAKAGDKVRFRAEKEGAAYVLTKIEPAK